MRKTLKGIVTTVEALLLPAMALAIFVVPVGASARMVKREHVNLELDWAFEGPESVFVYGKKLGFYRKNGLIVKIDRGNGSNTTVLRVASGAYDFGWAALPSLIKYNLEHPRHRLEAVYISEANSPFAIVTLTGRGIKTPKNLDGKTIDATPGSAALALFKVFAQKTGINPATIKWKHVSGQLRDPLMVKGDADALAGFTTSSILNIHHMGVPFKKIVVFRYNNYGVQQYGRALIVRQSYMHRHPQIVREMVAAVNEATKAAIENPMASANTLPARAPLVNVKTECARLVEGLTHLTLSPHFRKDGLSSVLSSRLRESVSEIKDSYRIQGQLPVGDIYTAKFLPSRADRIPPQLGKCQ